MQRGYLKMDARSLHLREEVEELRDFRTRTQHGACTAIVQLEAMSLEAARGVDTALLQDMVSS